MSEIKVSKLTNRAGTGAPDFSQGVKIEGTASTLLAPTRTESATEPTSPSNGDTWYDTDNDTYDVYIDDEWKRFIGESSEVTYTYDFDIDDLTYANVSSPSLATQDSTPKDFAFNSDGTQLIMYGQSTDYIYEYDLSTAYDVSTMSYTNTSYYASFEPIPGTVAWGPDGTKLYVQGYNSDKVHRLSASTAYDISTLSQDNVTFSLLSQDNGMYSASMHDSGTRMYAGGYVNDSIYQYDLSTDYDMTSATYVRSFSTASQTTTPYAIAFNSDGTKMYVLSNTGDKIFQYNLSTAWDISTASYSNLSFSVASQENSPRCMRLSPDGTKLWVGGSGSDKIHQYNTGV